MAKKSVKEAMAGAQVANTINDIMIEKTFENLEKPELTEQEKANELALLKKGLDNRTSFQKAEMIYREIQAQKKGYIVGWASATVGAAIGILGPKAFVAIKEHLKKN